MDRQHEIQVVFVWGWSPEGHDESSLRLVLCASRLVDALRMRLVGRKPGSPVLNDVLVMVMMMTGNEEDEIRDISSTKEGSRAVLRARDNPSL